jgi:hypothetical protein
MPSPRLPPVEAALDELRRELRDERVDLAELVVLGAEQKLARLRAERASTASLRRQLADQIRGRRLPIDPAAAETVRRSGWARS